ncbi:MAG: tetratricopeptide repeat protein [Gammaproteobacteria bacterium]|nr:tetratricopeptide repeat protein [Gammaproteobacteria bacterium]
MTRIPLLLIIFMLLQACAGNGGRLGPTIAELESRTIDIEPQVSFDIDNADVINSYRQLVEITPRGDEYGKELQRLADLELEASMDNRLSEDPAIQDQGLLEAKIAISRYQQYLVDYPNRPDNDMVLYQLSRAYAIESQVDEAQQVMDQLARDFPQSRYIDEVQFRRGEYLFVSGQYVQAELAYAVVVQDHEDSIYYEKSLYKLGWSQFKQNQNRAAIGSYVKLLDRKQDQQMLDKIKLAENLSRTEQELVEDVLRVISLAFSYLPDREPIGQFFNTAGQRAYEPLLYQELAELYLSKQRITDAANVYLAYGERYPYSPFRPQFHSQVIEIYKGSTFSALLLPEKQKFVEQFNVGTSFWQQQNPATQAELQPILATHISDIATHYHATARASKKSKDYRVAAGWYQLYLDSFPQDPKAAYMNFLLAESRFDAGQFALAINDYEKTAYDYPAHKDSAEAGYAALIAYDRLYQASKKADKPALNQRLIQSSLRFSDSFPNDKRMPAVLIKTTAQFFDLKQYTQAQQGAERLINRPNTDPKITRKAWVIVAHSRFELANYPNAELAYIEVLKVIPRQDKSRKEIRERLALSIYRQGELARDSGQFAVAAEHFIRVGKTVPSSPKRITADYDAATAYISLQDWNKAIIQLEGFRKKYPKHKKWRQGISEKLALAYKSNGNPKQSADEVMKLVKIAPKTEHKLLLWQAAELYEDAEQPKQAVAIYKTYIKKYPKPLSQSIELRHKISLYYQERKDNKRYTYWLKEIVKADSKGGKQRTGRTRYLAATASLELVEPLRNKYYKARLTLPLKKSLKRKKQLMKQSLDAYGKAAKYQVEEVTTAATFEIAEIYRDFANSLMESDRPKNLNEEELEEYNYLLEDQAYPFEEKAISIHQSNLVRIPDGSYDDAIKDSLQALAKLMPFRYDKNEVKEKYVEVVR